MSEENVNPTMDDPMQSPYPKYLSTFDSDGNRTATYLCNSEEEVSQRLAEGCVEISEDDWNTYIGNRGDGIRYVRGADGQPTPYVDTLDEVKTKAIGVQYAKYEALKYAVAWLNDGSGYGFDTDKDSISDWTSVMQVLTNNNATSGYYRVYTDKANPEKKEFKEVSLAQLIEAGNVSRDQQTSAYTGFEVVKTAINACTTKEELEQYLI